MAQNILSNSNFPVNLILVPSLVTTGLDSEMLTRHGLHTVVPVPEDNLPN